MEKNYHNSDGSCSHSSVISYRSYGSTVLNKNNNNEHGEYYGTFISFKVQISQNSVKSVQIRIFSGPYFYVFGPNTGKYGPEKTPYLDTFHAASKQGNQGFVGVQPLHESIK